MQKEQIPEIPAAWPENGPLGFAEARGLQAPYLAAFGADAVEVAYCEPALLARSTPEMRTRKREPLTVTKRRVRKNRSSRDCLLQMAVNPVISRGPDDQSSNRHSNVTLQYHKSTPRALL